MKILLFRYLFQFVILFFTFFVTVESIRCYQCSSTDLTRAPYQCSEYFGDSDLDPESCDSVYNARYCIKQIGRFEATNGIRCFQCDSSWDMSCTDIFISDGSLNPESCDYIHEAEYCVKMTGGIGTKRFCSASDLGNYCNYVKQPGDNLEYRSCYFTCSEDGCNSGKQIKSSFYFSLFPIISIVLYLTYL